MLAKTGVLENRKYTSPVVEWTEKLSSGIIQNQEMVGFYEFVK